MDAIASLIGGSFCIFLIVRVIWLNGQLYKYKKFMPKAYRRINQDFLSMLMTIWVWDLEKFINYRNQK